MKRRNLDYTKNTQVTAKDLQCKCGKETNIVHVSNWHDGTGIFYAKCKCGIEQNIRWEVKKYKFFKGNLKANAFELSLDELKEKYLAYLQTKEIEWVIYYGHETVNTFINSKDGLDSSTDSKVYPELQDKLMNIRHTLYP